MTAKRHFGRIRRLPSGRWQVRYPDGAGRDIPGPQTFATKGEAQLFLAAVEADMARGQFIDPRLGRTTLVAWAKTWLARPGKRPATVARDHQAIEWFMESLGHMPLSALKPGHVQAAVDARAKLVAPSTLVRDFAALRAVLNAAADAELIGRSPARKVALPQVRPPERTGLTPGVLARLVAEVPAVYRVVVLVGAVLGLRWGEAVGLRVRDVDFLRRTVTVAQVVEELAGNLRVVPEPKTAAGLRTLAAPPFLVDELARHIAEYRGGADVEPEDLVFVGPRGGILRRRFCERVLRPAVERVLAEDKKAKREPSLPAGFTFHGLRHSAVTAMADAGVPLHIRMARAGHATARMSFHYTHETASADRAAAGALEDHFRSVFAGEAKGSLDPEVAGSGA